MLASPSCLSPRAQLLPLRLRGRLQAAPPLPSPPLVAHFAGRQHAAVHKRAADALPVVVGGPMTAVPPLLGRP